MPPKRINTDVDAIDILRDNHKKRSGGLGLFDKINEDVIASISNNKTKKYVCNDVNSEVHAMCVPNVSYKMIPHIPLFKSRYLGFLSGESGLGKTSLICYFIAQTYEHLTKNIYFVSGKDDIANDPNVKKLKYIKFINGEDLKDLTYAQFKNSLVVFDDIDYWEFHGDAIKLMNNMVEKGRSLGINILYGSHITSKVTESPIYKEVDLYVTNNVNNNRMISIHLNFDKNVTEEISEYLVNDCFVCYNKIFRAIITDNRIYKL